MGNGVCLGWCDGCCFSPDDMNIVTFILLGLCVRCVFTQNNTQRFFKHAVYHAIIRIIIDILRVMCYNGKRYRKRG